MTLRFSRLRRRRLHATSVVLDLLSEFIDANADTVCLITGADRRTELEWLAHCDYLRALQRLGARDARPPRSARSGIATRSRRCLGAGHGSHRRLDGRTPHLARSRSCR